MQYTICDGSMSDNQIIGESANALSWEVEQEHIIQLEGVVEKTSEWVDESYDCYKVKKVVKDVGEIAVQVISFALWPQPIVEEWVLLESVLHTKKVEKWVDKSEVVKEVSLKKCATIKEIAHDEVKGKVKSRSHPDKAEKVFFQSKLNLVSCFTQEVGSHSYGKTYEAEYENAGAEGGYKGEESVEWQVGCTTCSGAYCYKSKFHWVVVKVE